MSLPQSSRDYEGQLLCFEPRYGWGWYRLGVSDGDRHLDCAEVDAAGPFHIRVHRFFDYEGEPRGLVGRVEQAGHLFDGLWAATWTMVVGAFDFGAFGRIGIISSLMLVFTLVFTNFFDAMGTMTGLAKAADLSDERGDFPRLKGALVVEGFGAVAGGATSSSSNTVFIESASGIGEGARITVTDGTGAALATWLT